MRIIEQKGIDVTTFGATVLILDSKANLYHIREHLRNGMFEYVRGINGKPGLDRWLRVIHPGPGRTKVVKQEAELTLKSAEHKFKHVLGDKAPPKHVAQDDGDDDDDE